MTEVIPIGIVMWGKEKVGKSTIVNVWSDTPQPSSYDHHEPRKVEVDYPIGKTTLKLQIYDVAAENIEDNSVTMETHNKSGPIQIFVMSADEDNDDVDYCRTLFESPMWSADDVKLTVIILNKIDIQHNNNEELLKSFLEKYPKVLFFKTTISDPEGIKKALSTIVQEYASETGIKLTKKNKKEKSSKKQGCKNQ
ncbi:hypothetical protein EDI_146040 [Entamoeba dispar SAW760]|uniref:Uncharacterized protein n=1 Tax=Entamoeba dispar (strain ATCC PRA-260 / SAW760) TaxID=370354 RepID=B0EUA7_ENTDS|nr:uncharacterized protein EDI_146040 [Entamoeba dispar SAW760]EDR21896.1 hypothetical protein EDI_146040 [Entamoeba dispar SAW760]|eukprot:EDR21896.1 hypothetical protein EDI_146040 [Entamoeba dispar SAW760]